MTLVQTEPKKIYIWVDYPEQIIYKMNAVYNYLIIPTWCNAYGWWNYYPYNRKISIDGWAETTYSWTWSYQSKIMLSWYTWSHTITIKPVVEDYWWAKAYSWYNIETDYCTGVTDIVYDSSYMWYAVSATDTGNGFRYMHYYKCVNLTSPAEEYMPDTVTTIWEWFRVWEYYNCTWLTKWADEVLPNNVTTIWKWFRANQYDGCASLATASDEVMPNSITTIWDTYRSTQYMGCTSLTKTPKEALSSWLTSMWTQFRIYQYYNCSALNEIQWWIDGSVWNSYYRYQQFYGCNTNKTIKVLSNVWYASYDNNTLNNSYVTSVSVPSAYLSTFQNTSNRPRVNITDSKFVWY